ncbi:MAG: D-2-hydroxyacid dehydrogenase [Desulfohalobiaceae bacterium]|nr:D-2-hydroxyacid dehydrogenase [Desulfohalobiaceae bacterium]
MRIVVLDGYTMNPGDLSWQPLYDLGECTIYDRSTAEQVVERAAGAQIVLTNKTPISARHLDELEGLQYIGMLSTGYDVVDVHAAARKNIPVTNVPGYATDSVAQMVLAHLLHFTQHAAHHSQGVRRGEWSARSDFCYWDLPLVELRGMTFGVVGLGRIGSRVADLARTLGMRVLAHTLSGKSTVPEGVELTDLETLLRESDVVSLHCKLSEKSRELIDAKRLALMKDSALLINTSRGPLVQEQALADALNEGRLAGAGMDVMSREPPAPDNPLLTAKNCLITPHISWATTAARQRLLQGVAENIRRFLQSDPVHVVNA